MSLLSKGLRKLGGNIKTVLRSPVGKVVGSLIPGVSTAIAVGSVASTAYDAYKAATGGRGGIMPTPGFGGGGGGGGMRQAVAPAPLRLGTGDEIRAREALEAAGYDPDTGYPVEWGGQNLGAGSVQQAGLVGTIAGRAGPIIGRAARKVAPVVGGAVAGEIIGRLMPGGNGTGHLVPAGYHYNKALRRYEIAEAQGREVQDPRDEPRVKNELVRNRSMNPLNPRALARANRRVMSFAGISRGMLRQLGFTVSSTRKAKGGKRRGGRR